jgi:general L-amino acid transport system permease protein
MPTLPAALGATRRLWRRPGVRALVWQAMLAAAIGTAVWWVAGNVATNLPRLKMDLRFTFISETASFELGDNLLGYRAGDSFARAFAAGLANTLQVSLLGIVLTAIVGTVVALMRLSGNLLVGRLAWFYVEVARNLPLLLQLLFWETILVRLLPPPRDAWAPLPGVVVSNRGASFPTVQWQPAFTWALFALAVGLSVAFAVRRRRAAASPRPAGPGGLLWWLCALPPLGVIALAAGAPVVEVPALRGFNVVGGVTLVPEFFALLFGLVFCHAGFAAESIRAGVLGVAKGQWDAARALGLHWWPTMRLVVLPQALRIMVPPLTSNFLSLTKSSSLAVAIGYPDLLRVSTVAISETGRAVECISIILLIYLGLSLATSALMNWYNHRIALQGAKGG